jgi:hypothetical protein
LIDKKIVSYYEIGDYLNIYYLKDDVYTTWRHNSIVYYLAKYICMECPRLESKLQAFLRSDIDDYDNWLYD